MLVGIIIALTGVGGIGEATKERVSLNCYPSVQTPIPAKLMRETVTEMIIALKT